MEPNVSVSKQLWSDSLPWPRRLLHVPTMTSYSWQAGNIYGAHEEPRYNALSYTWGRWEIGESVEPHVRGLRVNEIQWLTPRIRPSHFTNGEILDTVKAASVNAGSSSTDFLWLDIACIDQRPSSLENAIEVGRQAIIFRHARAVFVWLTSFESKSSFSELNNKAIEAMGLYQNHARLEQVLQSLAPKDDFLEVMDEQLQRLRKDPWCSSLWTLQEAFLRPDAFLLFRMQSFKAEEPLDFEHAFNWLNLLLVYCQLTDQDCSDRAKHMAQAVSKLGFVAAGHICREKPPLSGGPACTAGSESDAYVNGPTENPFNVLNCSKVRTASREEDRIYGIMQVFNLRLGKSAPNETRTNFSFAELKSQLEDALLNKYPIASQLIIQPAECEIGDSWIIHGSGVVSFDGEKFWRPVQEGSAVEHWAKLGTRVHNGRRWGHFHGTVMTFVEAEKQLDDIIIRFDRRQEEHILAALAEENGAGLEETSGRLDFPSPMADQKYLLPNTAQLEIRRLEQQRKIAAAQTRIAKEKFPAMCVVLLGSLSINGGNTTSTGFGICLSPYIFQSSYPCYERLGTITFRSSKQVRAEILADLPSQEGLFG